MDKDKVVRTFGWPRQRGRSGRDRSTRKRGPTGELSAMKPKLWLISQDENNSYEVYGSAVVAAKCIGEVSPEIKNGEVICASFNAG